MKSLGFPNVGKVEPVLKPENEEDDETNKGTGCCWWSPKQNTLAVAFCNETSIHGFKFLGQEKRHVSERIFWIIGFIMSFSTAIYLIYNVYDRYQRVPVIVSFQSSEQEMDTIPFPAVTLCNMNKFPKTAVLELQRIAGDPNNPNYKNATKQLIFVRNACNAQQSFAKDFHFAHSRGTNKHKKRKGQEQDPAHANETELSDSDLPDMTDFLMRKTLSCDQLIRLCMLGEEEADCGVLFKPIITDYGKCCVFNILPLPLLLKNPDNAGKPNASVYDNPVLGSDAKKNWPEDFVKEWKKWNYEDGFVLSRKSKEPWRQKRAGLPYGLSVLLDPNLEDYYCPASDSVGIRYILHTPLEMPHVMEFSSVAHMGKEVLIEVHPDVTNADDDIRGIEPEKRLCYFGIEKSLRFFGPYTGGNCVDECTAKILTEKCGCTLFYMPRDNGIRICDSDPDSEDTRCTEVAKMDLQAHMKEECGHCETLCEDIAYNYETTIADLQPNSQLWGDPNPVDFPNGRPPWWNHTMSVVHIFFGAESTVPKFRKRLYGTTDLIANTGGILGLCLGFSILSGVEVVYFFTLRAFWKYCRKRRIRKEQEEQNTKTYISQLLFNQKQNSKVIQLNPNQIPVYPHDMAIRGAGWGAVRNPAQRVLGGGMGGWGNEQGHHFYGAQSFQKKMNHAGYTYY